MVHIEYLLQNKLWIHAYCNLKLYTGFLLFMIVIDWCHFEFLGKSMENEEEGSEHTTF